MDRRDLELHSAADCMLYTSHLVWCTLDAMPVNRHALERSLEQRIGLHARPISAASSHAVRALVCRRKAVAGRSSTVSALKAKGSDPIRSDRAEVRTAVSQGTV